MPWPVYGLHTISRRLHHSGTRLHRILTHLNSTATRLHSTSSPTAEPLRILFCGSDHFSIASLHALAAAKRQLPVLIHDIHVAHRPAKPTGRGLKTLREVPISHAARHLALPTHSFDTFTGWSPPFSYNLVVAVSFGLLVPPRILSLARYGGLNVHPSLLPDLRGSAPIEHAIIKQRSHTGVSVQTLHPTKFDHGVVLAQTPAPGIPISKDDTAHSLKDRLATVGAEMLLDVLKARAFVPPLQHTGWYTTASGPVDDAPKITKQDRFIDFPTMDMAHILAIQRALGDTWCVLPNNDRIVMHEMVDLSAAGDMNVNQAGLWASDDSPDLLFRAVCGRVGAVRSSTYAGGKPGTGNAKAKKTLARAKL